MKKKIIVLILTILIIGGILLFKNFGIKEDVVVLSDIKDDMVLVNGGTFKMGSPKDEYQRESDEVYHDVTVDDFYMSATEVSNSLYELVMGSVPSEFDDDELPVTNVSWYDAISFCNKLSQMSNLMPVYTIKSDGTYFNREADGYRLPTEAEWEYAARANSTTPFSTGEAISTDEANYYGTYPYKIEEHYFEQDSLDIKPGVYRGKPISVKSFNANSFGLYNMHGNVREWVYDYYGEYDVKDNKNPVGASDGLYRVTRGGGYNDYAKHLRSAYRSEMMPTTKTDNIGFRIVRNVKGINNIVKSKYDDENSSKSNALIVYFSWGGNTKMIANMIEEKLGADIFEITLKEPYSDDYNEVLKQAQKDLNDNARPEIKNKVKNISSYDVILLGYPNWWASVPMPILSFLEGYDLSYKTIIPFCSHGGGGFGESISQIAKSAHGVKMGVPLSVHYSGDSSLSDDIDAWLKENGLVGEV
ncbi:MAG: flavodoxin [bacterium]|nr:flavodoxin [bacterium]